eukprot:5911483-Alexandrium_andersonii.AAC.1
MRQGLQNCHAVDILLGQRGRAPSDALERGWAPSAEAAFGALPWPSPNGREHTGDSRRAPRGWGFKGRQRKNLQEA